MPDNSCTADFLTDPYIVGEWCVDPVAREIWPVKQGPSTTGDRRRVDPKPIQVLAVLAESSGQVVTRQELFERVWLDAVVVDEALTRCVMLLRKAFDAGPDHPAVIETVRGSGYRLLPSVSPMTRDRAELAPERPALRQEATSIARRALALTGVLVAVSLAVSIQQIRNSAADGMPTFFSATVSPGIERDADWTTDGSRLVFARSRDGRHFDLGILDSLGGEPRELDIDFSGSSDHPVRAAGIPDGASGRSISLHAPVFSPDGSRIAFMARDGNDCRIMISSDRGSDLSEAGSCRLAHFNQLEWSPDGRRLLFSEGRSDGPPESLVMVTVDGSERRVLTDGGGARYGDHHAVFSPNGQRIAFIRTPSEAESDVWVLDLDTEETVRITEDRAVVAGLDWLSNDQVLFSSNRSGQFQLWQLQLWQLQIDDCSCSAEWIPTGTENAFDPKVAHQTGSISFYHDRTTSSIYFRDGAVERALVSNAATNTSPHISPDGRQIVFVSNATGARELWIADRDGSNARPLTGLGVWTDSPRWSPDGEAIAFNASPDGHQDLHVLEVGTGEIRRLTTDPSDETNPRWSLDGKRLYYASNREGTWMIRVMDPQEAPGVSRSTGIPGIVAMESAANRLLVARPDKEGLRAWTTDFQPAGIVVQDLHEVDWGGWSIEGEWIFHLVRDPDGVDVRRTPIDGGASTERGRIASGSTWDVPWQSTTIDSDPDGSGLVFVRFDAAEGEIRVIRR